jgi:hypothetical protein
MAASSGFYDKFPDEIVEFDFDASDILFNSDTIQSVQVLALSGGIAIPSSSFSGSTITFRVSGGTAGKVAYAVVKATLTSGQLREGPITIVVKSLPGA